MLLVLLLHWYKTVSVEWGRLLTFKSPISTVLLILALFCSQSTLNACLSHYMKMSEVLWVESLCSYIMLWGWLYHSYPPSRKKDGSSLLIIHTPCDDIPFNVFKSQLLVLMNTILLLASGSFCHQLAYSVYIRQYPAVKMNGIFQASSALSLLILKQR